MYALPGIFFHVDPRNPYPSSSAVLQIEMNIPVVSQGGKVLCDLIPLGKVCVKIVFASELIVRSDLTIHRQSQQDSILQNLLVEAWQGTWMTQGNRRQQGIGQSAEFRAIRTECLGLSIQLHVNLQAHDQFIID